MVARLWSTRLVVGRYHLIARIITITFMFALKIPCVTQTSVLHHSFAPYYCNPRLV